MKYLVISIFVLTANLASAVEFENACHKSVNQQLVASGSGQLVAQDQGRQEGRTAALSILSVNTELSETARKNLEDLIIASDNIVFSYGNDAGVWLVIANHNSCQVLKVELVIAH